MADAVQQMQQLLGICDGVSGVQQLGFEPSSLPRDLLACCGEAMKRRLEKQRAGEPRTDADVDGYWMLSLMMEAFDATSARGATTLLLASLEEGNKMVVGNIGDCGLLLLRPAPYENGRLSREWRSTALRYEANRPKQVVSLDSVNASDVHLVIQGAKLDVVEVQRGDLVVLGSDGLFDNLSDEEITQIVELHCTGRGQSRSGPPGASPEHYEALTAERRLGERPPPTERQLKEAAEALVVAAIDSVRVLPNGSVNVRRNSSGPDKASPVHVVGNADDTTALVGVIVEARYAQENSHKVRTMGRENSRHRDANSGFLGGLFPHCCKASADREDFEDTEHNIDPRRRLQASSVKDSTGSDDGQDEGGGCTVA